jgi:tetrahedral aminopeptidase
MDDDRHALLWELLNTAAPTGSERVIQRLIHDRFKGVADQIEPDVMGNLLLTLNPNAPRKVMLSGHCDQIGFLVKYISDDGYVYLDPLGGTDSGVLLGERLVIQTNNGPVVGIVGRKPVHMQSGSEVQQIPIKDKIWVDLGCSSRDEALQRVAIGDSAIFMPQITRLSNNRIAAPALDNKAGLFVCLEVLRQLAADRCDVGVYVLCSAQEEIGSRGAAVATNRISPDVGIAVDTAPATDDPANDKPPQHNVACKIGHGPSVSIGPNTNPVVGKLLMDAAKRGSIPHQIDPSGQPMPNDSRTIQTGDSGVAAATVGIPQRNMHTQVEIVSLDDLDHAVNLLVGFIRSIRNDTDFRPFYFRD